MGRPGSEDPGRSLCRADGCLNEAQILVGADLGSARQVSERAAVQAAMRAAIPTIVIYRQDDGIKAQVTGNRSGNTHAGCEMWRAGTGGRPLPNISPF